MDKFNFHGSAYQHPQSAKRQPQSPFCMLPLEARSEETEALRRSIIDARLDLGAGGAPGIRLSWQDASVTLHAVPARTY